MPRLIRRTDVPHYTDYKHYKAYIRIDLKYACAYCQIHENEFGGPRNFHVEHYRPRSLFRHLETAYTNLVYGCCVCNSFKSNDWPSDDPIADGVGYLDPCEHDYDEHFVQRQFRLIGLSAVATYMVERLHLNRVQLCKLREQRALEAERYSVFCRLFEITLRHLKGQINTLNDIDREVSIQEIAELKTLFEKHVNRFAARWEPQIEMEDYS